MGTLAATGHAQGATGFTYSSTEHGYILVLASARADLTYQQGLRKLWSRSTRYDFYFPVFAMLGEQAVLNKEIYSDGSANDAAVFGYQERWASTDTTRANHRHLPIHQRGNHRLLAQRAEIHSTADAERHVHQDDAATVTQRNFAGGALTANQQLLCDFFCDMTVARPLPMYSVPGMIDHF